MDKTILEALRAALIERTPLDALPEDVWRGEGTLNTWGTNAIEGSTLTLEDVEGLLVGGRTPGDRPVRDVLEALQHAEAFRSLMKRRGDPITLTTVLELHATVFRGVLGDAGMWRRVNVVVRGASRRPPRAERVVARMDEWARRLHERDVAGEDVLELGAWMHHAFELVHPFSDGNGRVGRLLLNLHLLRHNWPPVEVTPAERDAYIASLERASDGNPGPLEELLGRAMARSLLRLLDKVGTAEDELVDLATLEAEGPYSAKYLALRASDGKLPALREGRRWLTSRRALGAYRASHGRRGA